MAALRLRMDRVTTECARFLLSQLDLASCLDLRSMPGVAPELFAIPDIDKDLHSINGKDESNVTSSSDEAETDFNKHSCKRIDLMDRIDDFIGSNLDQLSETRQLRALPRICLEVLHLSKEERNAAQHPRPLCELALDWSVLFTKSSKIIPILSNVGFKFFTPPTIYRTRNQWLDDETLTLDRFTKKRHLLYMSTDGSNTLKVNVSVNLTICKSCYFIETSILK